MNETFVTMNARLEQFLFYHRIRFLQCRKNEDMMTEWVYERTPKLEQVVKEYREIWGAK